MSTTNDTAGAYLALGAAITASIYNFLNRNSPYKVINNIKPGDLLKNKRTSFLSVGICGCVEPGKVEASSVQNTIEVFAGEILPKLLSSPDVKKTTDRIALYILDEQISVSQDKKEDTLIVNTAACRYAKKLNFKTVYFTSNAKINQGLSTLSIPTELIDEVSFVTNTSNVESSFLDRIDILIRIRSSKKLKSDESLVSAAKQLSIPTYECPYLL